MPRVTVFPPAASRAARLISTVEPPKRMPSSCSGTVSRFMAGEPMNPATNLFAGRSYMVRGESHCWRMPSARTATRSPIVIASTWSWVT